MDKNEVSVVDPVEQIRSFEAVFETKYITAILDAQRSDHHRIVIDFTDIAKQDIDLANMLLEQPEEAIKTAELAVERFINPELRGKFKVRFKNLPKSQELMIRNVRSSHIGRLFYFNGVVRQKSDVRPQVTTARFECPSCGNIISLLQLDNKFREPSRCNCGRKGHFFLIGKELIDAQGIVLEESTEELEGGEQPKRMNVFLRDDLVSPITEKHTNPGSKILVVGSVKEIPVAAKDGGKLTRYDLLIEANHVEAVQEDFMDMKIKDQEVEKILEIGKDPKGYQRLIKSLAPSIYGYEKIKEALLLQLAGGVRKKRSDGSVARGDMHVLLIGDPGCLCGDSQVAVAWNGMNKLRNLGQEHGEKINVAVSKIRKNAKDSHWDFATRFQHYRSQPVLLVKTETGKELICTFNQPFLTKEGWKRADDLLLNEKIRVMPQIPNRVKKLADTNFEMIGGRKEVEIPSKYTPELAALCGYLIGDGYIETDYRTSFYINEEETDLIDKLSLLVQQVFSISTSLIRREGGGEKTISENGLIREFISSQQIYQLVIYSKQISHNLSILKSKRVPQAIFQSPKEVIAPFISWLFEADGCTFGYGRGRTSIQLKSRTEGLLKDVQQLLLYFGIQSRIIEDNLSIRRSFDMELFAKHIGFQSIKKTEKLQKTLEMIAIKSDQQKRGSYQRWEKVVEVLPAGIRDVYDIEVPKSERFIANGIVVHNSGKSQLLKRISQIAPKGRYVAGKGSSAAGLCVAPQSFIFTNPGGLEKIENVVESRLEGCQEYRENIWRKEGIKDIKIQSMSNDLKLHAKHPSAIWKLKAPQEVNEITLRSGKKIELTQNTQLLTIKNGRVEWKKSIEYKEGEYIATPRWTIGGNVDKLPTVSLISSNPVVHNIKPFVKEVVYLLQKKYGTIRDAAKALNLKENSLYHNWINEDARGNIKLTTLTKLCKDVKVDYAPHVNKVSLYNGKIQSIPLFISKDTLYLAGIIAGDGDMRKSNSTVSIRLSNNEDTLHNEFKRIIEKEFSLHWDSRQISDENCFATRTHSKLLSEILLALGIPFSPKSNKIIISDKLLHFSNEYLSNYIAGLYDTDGSLMDRKGTGGDCIEFTTCSEMLARQLQLVFLRFGIHARLRQRAPSGGVYKHKIIQGKLVRWVLSIWGFDDIQKFNQNIPIRHPKKKEILNSIIKKNSKASTNVDLIPQVSNSIYSILRDLGIPTKEYNLMKKRLSRKKGLRILKEVRLCELDDIEKIIKSDIYWDKIATIRHKKPNYEYVYDLTVEDSHNFVVDGILVHNTASVVKDEFLGGWALEAGAMVLANHGFLMIDEMDKMSKEDTSALHEGLEQQQISIAKANIQATLRCETTVLAAANPKFGRFDPHEILAKQIDMPPALINRFDLIFPIKDLPDQTKDERLASHVLNLHQNPDYSDQDIDTDVLKKFISYVRQKFQPVLTTEAIEEIKKFYVQLRNQGQSEEGGIRSVPISARQLEALVRLAEASAKVHLRNTVTVEDAKRGIDLLYYCLTQVGLDPETGKIDIDRIATGIGATQRSTIHQVREIINDLEAKIGKTIPIDDIINEARERGMSESVVDEAIERLKRTGDLFEPKQGWISKL